MSNYSLIRAPLLSFYSKPFYQEVAVSWRGAAYAYLLLVLAICWLPFLAEVYGNWSRFMGGHAERLLEQIPAVSISNGVVASDVPQPHYIHSAETGQVFAILDTTGQVQSLEGLDARILVTRTQFILKKGERETRIYDLSAVQNFAIDSDRVRRWLNIGSVWGPPAVYVLMVVLSYGYRLLQALLFGLVALAFRRSVRFTHGYAGAVRLALVAASPAVILKTGLDALGITFPFRELAILAIAFCYLYLGLVASGTPAPIEGAGETATTPN